MLVFYTSSQFLVVTLLQKSFCRYIAQTVIFTGNIIMVIIADISPDAVSECEINIF